MAAAREALELEGNTARLVRVAARALAAAGAAVRGVLDERGDARGTAQRLGGGRRRHHLAAVAVVLVLLELLDLVVQLVDGVGCVPSCSFGANPTHHSPPNCNILEIKTRRANFFFSWWGLCDFGADAVGGTL